MITFRIALRALAKSKLRAGLTVLGIVIGIAAVTTMVSIGQSASRLVQDQFSSLGTNMIMVMPKRQRRQGVRQGNVMTLTSSDAEAIEEECPAILAASPIVGAQGQVIYQNANWSPNELLGVSASYLTVRNWTVRAGGFFTENEVRSSDKVCVLGQTPVEKLFQTTNPIGQTVRIANIPFRVIGVLQEKGANLFGQDQDDVILMPFTTVRQRIYGSRFDDVHVIMASARSAELAYQAENEVRQLLADRHAIPPGGEEDFEVGNAKEIANILGMITGTLTLTLASIAGISLLVGGVGIMNIMLVSVTERTREIGIRMAVGARGRDILRQFLVESILLSVFGGVIGFALGVAASAGVTSLINSFTADTKWPVVVSIPAAIAALIFSAGVGVFFGFYPARRASRLDPIEALRYE